MRGSEKSSYALKNGKTRGIDGVVSEWWHKKRSYTNMWTKSATVLLYRGKGSKNYCTNYRVISLLCIAGDLYGTIMTELKGLLSPL